jgi:hypothetical protein
MHIGREDPFSDRHLYLDWEICGHTYVVGGEEKVIEALEQTYK